jgi:hypothetical protein
MFKLSAFVAAVALATLTACGTAATGSAVSATGTVSANSATGDQLVAAFTAHGVPDPMRWAAEVDEYRPYPTDDPAMAKLRAALIKEHADDATLTAIFASITP